MCRAITMNAIHSAPALALALALVLAKLNCLDCGRLLAHKKLTRESLDWHNSCCVCVCVC
ncbi:hypothetical protein AGMMS49941_00010 [Deferribacterales bacterium]|nr:hypothetical protein AGMMS49941_00010 [Deferribacterales bacterium]